MYNNISTVCRRLNIVADNVIRQGGRINEDDFQTPELCSGTYAPAEVVKNAAQKTFRLLLEIKSLICISKHCLVNGGPSLPFRMIIFFSGTGLNKPHDPVSFFDISREIFEKSLIQIF